MPEHAQSVAHPANIMPSPEFIELKRLSKLWDEAVAVASEIPGGDPAYEPAHAREAEALEPINALEAGVLSRPCKTLSDLLDRAAFTLFWSDAYRPGAFDNPIDALKRQGGDCFEKSAYRLAATIFEMAKGGANV